MEELELTIESVVFQSDDGKFSVFRGRGLRKEKISVVYKGFAPFPGEQVKIRGDWVEHPKFGRQMQALVCQSVPPSSVSGMERFLASGAVRGIGKATAARIVEYFGEATMQVLGEKPERLKEVEGIGAKKAEVIAASFAELSDLKELMLFLEENGLSANYAPKIKAAYGASALSVIAENPYRLAADVVGIGFRTADRLAVMLGLEADNPERIKAGLEFALVQASAGGHTYLPEELLLREAANLLQISSEIVYETFNRLIAEDLLRTEEYGQGRLVYPEYLYRAETGVARRLIFLRDKVNSLWQVNYEEVIEEWEKETGLKLAEAQAEAVKASLEHGVFVLTGGPGTGKTTVVKNILAVLEKAGCKIMLAAPTGRAARRLAESAGHPAATVHRLLEYAPNGEGYFFGRNSDNPLEADAIIVDEASMLDIVLAHNLLKAVPVGCRLILVGDVDQLPSVGPGTVLKDILRSKMMPVVRLESIFRQAAKSPIVTNAHLINKGKAPQCEPASDFSFEEVEDEEAAALVIVKRYAEIAAIKGWEEVQVLSPMHKNACGVANLNKLLQERMNPPAAGKAEIMAPTGLLRRDDKVMQTRNNYEKDVFNGDIGKITEISGRSVRVMFPERPEGESVVYEQSELDELQLSYAMSVHKSQGSEYNSVIIPLVRSHYILLQRNLLYTGVTRAKERVILVGSRAAVNTAVDRDDIRRRYTLLAERMQDEVNLF